MKRSTRSLMMTLSLVLTFAFSAMWTIPALADDTTPPPTATPEVAQPAATDTPAPEATLAPVVEEATQPAVETQPTDAPQQDAGQTEAASLASQVPAGTDVVVLDENGNPLSLATQEASQVIASDSDPMWCPATVLVPTANKYGCTQDYTTFQALLNYLISNKPTVDGVIWIAKGYKSSSADGVMPGPGFVLDGGTPDFATMSNYRLTIKGGWNGSGFSTIDLNDPSEFNAQLQILNWKNDVTLSDLIFDLSGVATTGDGLTVQTTKNIRLDRVSVKGNANGGGAVLNNSTGLPTMTVTINNRNTLLLQDTFSGNNGDGLNILSTGKITLANIVASNNNGGNGLNVNNVISSTKQGVTLSGLNDFKGNLYVGAYIHSSGLITLTDVTASNNGGFGADLDNTGSGNIATISFVGTNIFNDNLGGVQALTNGALTISNLYANSNDGFGANISNANSVLPQPVTISSSQFKFNGNSFGLQINTKGLVTITNITADSNNGIGLYVKNDTSTQGVVIKSTVAGAYTFNNNKKQGLIIESHGLITLTNITANGNGQFLNPGDANLFGAYIKNAGATPVQNVSLLGINTFNDNYYGGLSIYTDGIISLSYITASGNGKSAVNGSGVVLSNELTNPLYPKIVTLSGINTMSNNRSSGLVITSIGAITLYNLTANGNGADSSDAVTLDNSSATVAAGVSLLGTNSISDNSLSGLVVKSKGLIYVNSLIANGNGSLVASFPLSKGYGVDLDNTLSTTLAGITLAGTNSFNGNYDTGLRIQTNGLVSLINITAKSSSRGDGVNITNQSAGTLVTPQNVTLSGLNNFSSNAGSGLFIQSYGIITVSNVTADQNGSGGSEYGIYLDNSTANLVKPITLAGVNLVTATDGATGVRILSKGIITVNNLTASGTSNGDGAYLNNNFSNLTNSINVLGTNKFNDNVGAGLNITTLGSVTTYYVTANSNHLQGVTIDNDNVGAIGTVILAGTNTFNNNYKDGLKVTSLGNITISNVTANQNGINSSSGGGVNLDNSSALAKYVSITGINVFNGNYSYGLSVKTKGAITSALALTATGTTNAGALGFNAGIYLDNTFGTTASRQPVTLLGKTVVTDNQGYGLYIASYGLITVNGLNATGNAASGGHYDGAYLVNDTADTTLGALGVTVGGVNIASNNSWDGLRISTKGLITIYSLTANGNGLGINAAKGAILDNTAGTTAGVILAGVNNFIGNKAGGLDIASRGAITLTSITASNTVQGMGVTVDNATNSSLPQNITFTGLSVFNNNFDTGAEINTYGAVTFNGITANANGVLSGYGVKIDNWAGLPAFARNVVLNGTNTFTGNKSGGLYVNSLGSIIVNNLNASSSVSGEGAYLKNDNVGSLGAVTLTGINKFENNYTNGLNVFSLGAISLSNITAGTNGHSAVGYGVFVENHTAVAAQKVTLAGVNTFNGNKQAGLYVHSKGLVSLNTVTANSNGLEGVSIDNDEPGASGGVTFTGANTFIGNQATGLKILSQGLVSITKIVSNSNGGDGLSVVTNGNVTVMCGNFVHNGDFLNGTGYGWSITGASVNVPVLTLYAVVSSGNAFANTQSVTVSSTIVVRNCPLP